MSQYTPEEREKRLTLSYNKRLYELWDLIEKDPTRKTALNAFSSPETRKKNKLFELCEKLRERFKNIRKYEWEIITTYTRNRNLPKYFDRYKYFMALIFVYEYIITKNPEIMKSENKFSKVNNEIKVAILDQFYNFLDDKYSEFKSYENTRNIQDKFILLRKIANIGFLPIYNDMNKYLNKYRSELYDTKKINEINGFKNYIETNLEESKKNLDRLANQINKERNSRKNELKKINNKKTDLNQFYSSLEREYTNFINYLNSLSEAFRGEQRTNLLTKKARDFYTIYENMLDFLDKNIQNVNAYIQQNSIKPIIDKIERFKEDIGKILKLKKNNSNNSRRNQSQPIVSNSSSNPSQISSNRNRNSNNPQSQFPIQQQSQNPNSNVRQNISTRNV